MLNISLPAAKILFCAVSPAAGASGATRGASADFAAPSVACGAGGATGADGAAAAAGGGGGGGTASGPFGVASGLALGGAAGATSGAGASGAGGATGAGGAGGLAGAWGGSCAGNPDAAGCAACALSKDAPDGGAGACVSGTGASKLKMSLPAVKMLFCGVSLKELLGLKLWSKEEFKPAFAAAPGCSTIAAFGIGPATGAIPATATPGGGTAGAGAWVDGAGVSGASAEPKVLAMERKASALAAGDSPSASDMAESSRLAEYAATRARASAAAVLLFVLVAVAEAVELVAL